MSFFFNLASMCVCLVKHSFYKNLKWWLGEKKASFIDHMGV
jgi:hypothetical protein